VGASLGVEILARSVGVQVLALFQIPTTAADLGVVPTTAADLGVVPALSQVPALPQILVSSRDASLEYL